MLYFVSQVVAAVFRLIPFVTLTVTLWALTSSHMNLIGLIESTRVSAFQRHHIYASATLFREPSIQKKKHFRLGENNTFEPHGRKQLGFCFKLNGNSMG